MNIPNISSPFFGEGLSVSILKNFEQKTTIVESTNATPIITVENNYEYRFGCVNSINIIIPVNMDNDFITSVVFTSGTTATNFTISDSVKFSGSDSIEEVFVPIENMRYNIIIWYDGENLCGAVQKNTI